ncbi:MAG TPA: cyclic nucleotide-binding domain-containing protein [Acidimicrobiia bacterium]|nr:cyclic nucleotide-binding domain-containing protein [Acidimicrobiia bacterium]
MDTAAALKRSALFADFSDREIASVVETARERSFAQGEKIIEEGAEGGRAFYVLLEGSAQASKGGVVLADFEPGDYFGEMALLLEDTPRTADVVATSAARCLLITSWDLRALIKVHPHAGDKIMAELANRFHNNLMSELDSRLRSDPDAGD